MTIDSDVIKRIGKGDIQQFETLFRSSYVSLVRYAVSLIKDYDSAEEIVQDLFYRLWQNREKIKIKSSLNGYLYRSVHNSCIHYIEHRQVVSKHSAGIASEPEEITESPDDIMSYKELQDKVARILELLPEKCGRIFCMNRFEGLRYNEIAEKLSISVKTVEANMGRALKEFRKALIES